MVQHLLSIHMARLQARIIDPLADTERFEINPINLNAQNGRLKGNAVLKDFGQDGTDKYN